MRSISIWRRRPVGVARPVRISMTPRGSGPKCGQTCRAALREEGERVIGGRADWRTEAERCVFVRLANVGLAHVLGTPRASASDRLPGRPLPDGKQTAPTLAPEDPHPNFRPCTTSSLFAARRRRELQSRHHHPRPAQNPLRAMSLRRPRTLNYRGELRPRREAGDRVLFGKWSCTEVKLDGEHADPEGATSWGSHCPRRRPKAADTPPSYPAPRIDQYTHPLPPKTSARADHASASARRDSFPTR